MTPPPTDPAALVDRVVRLMKVLIMTQDAGAIEQVNILAECADTIDSQAQTIAQLRAALGAVNHED